MASAMYGPPPWDHSPTPPMEVVMEAWQRDPELFRSLKKGHLVNLLEGAMPTIAAAVEVMAKDQRRREVKAANQRRFRAARAALRAQA